MAAQLESPASTAADATVALAAVGQASASASTDAKLEPEKAVCTRSAADDPLGGGDTVAASAAGGGEDAALPVPCSAASAGIQHDPEAAAWAGMDLSQPLLEAAADTATAPSMAAAVEAVPADASEQEAALTVRAPAASTLSGDAQAELQCFKTQKAEPQPTGKTADYASRRAAGSAVEPDASTAGLLAQRSVSEAQQAALHICISQTAAAAVAIAEEASAAAALAEMTVTAEPDTSTSRSQGGHIFLETTDEPPTATNADAASVPAASATGAEAPTAKASEALQTELHRLGSYSEASAKCLKATDGTATDAGAAANEEAPAGPWEAPYEGAVHVELAPVSAASAAHNDSPITAPQMTASAAAQTELQSLTSQPESWHMSLEAQDDASVDAEAAVAAVPAASASAVAALPGDSVPSSSSEAQSSDHAMPGARPTHQLPHADEVNAEAGPSSPVPVVPGPGVVLQSEKGPAAAADAELNAAETSAIHEPVSMQG